MLAHSFRHSFHKLRIIIPSFAYSVPSGSEIDFDANPSPLANSSQNLVSSHSPIAIWRWRLNSAADCLLAHPSTMFAATDRDEARICLPSSNCSCLGNARDNLETSSVSRYAC